MLSSIPHGGGTSAEIEARRGISKEAARLIKAQTSWRRLDLLLAGNIKPGDVYATFTWDNAHYPKDRRDALRQWSLFRRKLTAKRRRCGKDLIAFWSLQRGDLGNRWHIHCVCNCGGETYEELEKLWGRGTVKPYPVERDKDGGFYTSIARYMARFRPEKLGQRAWSYTRNVRRPEKDSFFVDDNATLSVPEGCIILDRAERKTSFGEYQFIKYEIPNF